MSPADPDETHPPEYDPLRALREVHRILSRHEHTKRGLREQRAAALVAVAGPLGYFDAIARQWARDSGSSGGPDAG